jgi:hypothetical protein
METNMLTMFSEIFISPSEIKEKQWKYNESANYIFSYLSLNLEIK